MAASKELVVEALLLLCGLSMALAEDDPDGFSRYTWFVDLVAAMLEDAAASRLMNKRDSSPTV
jgi:hypothetical protein